MIETVITSIVAFTATNIDDIFILMMLFSQRNKFLRKHNIVAGQLLGMIVLIIISLAGMFAGKLLPREYIGLLGLFPIYLGLKSLYNLLVVKDENDDDTEIAISPNKSTWLSAIFSQATLHVSAITIANGSDNIGVYVPLFTAQSPLQLSTMIVIFLILTFCLIVLSDYLTRHPLIASVLQKTKGIMFPLVLIGLGIYILFECNTITLIAVIIHRLLFEADDC